MLRSIFEWFLRFIVPAGNSFDTLVIHDDFRHKDIEKVVLDNVTYGLIYRDKWNYIEEHTNKPIGAFDDPILAKKLLGQLL